MMASKLPTQGVRLTLDTIVIEEPRGNRRVSVAQFLELPLGERVRLILGRKVSFWSGNREIDREAALKNLMDR